MATGFKTLSEADHRLVTDAVGAAERGTDGEIVTIVADRSDDYRDVALGWVLGVVLVVLALAALLPGHVTWLFHWIGGGWEETIEPGELLPVLLAVAAIKAVAAWLLLAWQPLRLALTPRGMKTRRVHARAMQLFKVGAEYRTRGRVGVLIYLSVAEHRAEIVADSAIAAKVTAECWGDAMAAMIGHVRAGRPGEGMAEAVAQVGVVLARHFPKSEDDVNELPDRLIEL
ncbi:putative membrane protein [Sphingomonas zeicaulis]|uniref:TPM domain-containing protein n=1 Tax=Sphingomonas zeicaulis TaxID=1632740 RepID=UPI003D1A3CEA